MADKRFGSVLVALTLALAVGAAGVATASTSRRVAICFNRKNGVVHFSPSGKCAASQTRVFIGRGAIGARGVKGFVGVAGPQGLQGADGSSGASGLVGGTGASGLVGGTGASGGTGTSGGIGTSGGTGPVGGTGIPGLNTFHRVSIAASAGSGTIEAVCDAGEVVSGGGFVQTNSTVTGSAPNADGTRWGVTYISAGAPGPQLTAYAICVVGTSHA